jgi:hypothetical protein
VKRILPVLGIVGVLTVLVAVNRIKDDQSFSEQSRLQTTILPAEPTTTALSQTRPIALPTFMPADALIPAPTPLDDREIAILSLFVVSSVNGEVESVQLEQARITKSYAPSVLLLTGEWKVELIGRDSVLSYGIQDPRRVEMTLESEDESQPPFENMLDPELSWELVVPLYDGAEDLRVTEIKIYDVSGNLIFSTPVDRDGWSND